MSPQMFSSLKSFDRRHPSGDGRRKYQLKELRSRHQEILRRNLEGQSNERIAQDLSITPVAVSYTLNSDIGREKIEELQVIGDLDTASVIREIHDLIPHALQVHGDIVKDENMDPRIRQKSADSILDRGGFGRVTRVEAHMKHEKDVQRGKEEIRKRAVELGLIKPVIECSSNELCTTQLEIKDE